MTKEQIIKDTITETEFIETLDMQELADKFTSGNVRTTDIYKVYRDIHQQRVDYFKEELIEGLEITKNQDDEDITFDAGDYIIKAYEDGKSIMHCVKYLKLPTKSITEYLNYMGYETSSNTEGKINEIIDRLLVEREKSREIYYKSDTKFNDILDKEKEIKLEIAELLDKTANRKTLKYKGLIIKSSKEYNKRYITTQKIIAELGETKAKELFDIEPTKNWNIAVNTAGFDKTIKERINNGK